MTTSIPKTKDTKLLAQLFADAANYAPIMPNNSMSLEQRASLSNADQSRWPGGVILSVRNNPNQKIHLLYGTEPDERGLYFKGFTYLRNNSENK